jgi:hypothetical protein
MRHAILFVAFLLTPAALADPPEISALRLLLGWKDQDPNTRMLAEVIASAFSNGLSWRGEVYCPPPSLKGHEIMVAFERFVADNPAMAQRPYGDAMAATLSREFPCRAL